MSRMRLRTEVPDLTGPHIVSVLDVIDFLPVRFSIGKFRAGQRYSTSKGEMKIV